MAIVQRRSKPVNGSVLAFALVLGLVPEAGVGAVGVLFSFDGDVPVVGVGVVPVLGVVAGVLGGGEVAVLGVLGGGGVWL
jgi:hypothetical protein